MPLLKRLFDIIIIILASPVWIPAMLLTALAIVITSGWPPIYVSKRYVQKNTFRQVIKFRTMVKNAEQIANRETVEHDPDRMLNILIDDTLYTSLGKFLDKIHFTELPQLFQVLVGTLTLVGNRPMPENMRNQALPFYPFLEDRFILPSGITGPSQLVGRTNLTDVERLTLEITYCYVCEEAYTPLLDIRILVTTVFTVFGLLDDLSKEEIVDIMYNYVPEEKREGIRQRVEQALARKPETA